MKYEQLLAHFGGLTKAAQALETSKQVVHAWGVRNRIPARWQIRAAVLSNGRLKPDRESREEARAFAPYANGQRA